VVNDQLGIALTVMVVGLILKALWDLKNAPNPGDVRAALEVKAALDRRLDRIEGDLRDMRAVIAPLHDEVTRLIDRNWRREQRERGEGGD